MTDTIGDTNVTSTTASTIARPRNKVTEFPTVWEAFFLSSASDRLCNDDC